MVALHKALSDSVSVSRAPLLIAGVAVLLAASVWSCSDSSTSPSSFEEGGTPVLPSFADDNHNGINDYVEAGSHHSGTASATNYDPQTNRRTFPTPTPPEGAPGGHPFVDNNGDGVCDYAQDGSNTWHGPGFVDSDGDGICDYWQEGHPRHNRHLGLKFTDENGNRVEDFVERKWHVGWNHGYTDRNHDGICDWAQKGTTIWHGPGFIDADNDGVCDHWQPGGLGYRTQNQNRNGQ